MINLFIEVDGLPACIICYDNEIAEDELKAGTQIEGLTATVLTDEETRDWEQQGLPILMIRIEAVNFMPFPPMSLN